MPCEGNMILEFTQYPKSIKAPSRIYTDLDNLVKKMGNVKTIQKNHLQQEQVKNVYDMNI